MAVRIKDKDKGYRKVMAAMRKSLGITNITVGLHDDTEQGVLRYAAINIFGSSTIPPRDFVSKFFDKAKALLPRLGKAAMQQVVTKGVPPAIAARRIAVALAALMQAEIPGTPPPNAESTIKKKGSSVTLIDSGAMRQAVTAKVNGKVT